MNSAAKSVYYFGFYLLLLSVALTVFPNLLLSTFQLPETNEVWIRVVGVLVFSLGIYYIFMAQTNNTMFLSLSVYVRASILVWFIAFVLAKWVSPMLIVFGVADALGASWTYIELIKLRKY
jgi:uncharacterized membrane protein HdeD (DUF308 family)